MRAHYFLRSGIDFELLLVRRIFAWVEESCVGHSWFLLGILNDLNGLRSYFVNKSNLLMVIMRYSKTKNKDASNIMLKSYRNAGGNASFLWTFWIQLRCAKSKKHNFELRRQIFLLFCCVIRTYSESFLFAVRWHTQSHPQPYEYMDFINAFQSLNYNLAGYPGTMLQIGGERSEDIRRCYAWLRLQRHQFFSRESWHESRVIPILNRLPMIRRNHMHALQVLMNL